MTTQRRLTSKLVTCFVICSIFANGLSHPTACLAQKGERQAAADEYVVVTAPTGYLKMETAKGAVTDLLPTWTHLLVTATGKTYYEVTTPAGERGVIRRELVQPNPLRNPSQSDLIAAEKAVVLLVRSSAQMDKQDYVAALRLAEQAGREVENSIGRDNPLWPWVMSSVAFMQYANGDTAGMDKTLEKAEASLGRQKVKGIAAADLLNVRAFLLTKSGNHAGAAESYGKAIAIATRIGGKQHSDVRVIRLNFANDCAEIGNYDEAVRQQQIVYDIGKAILPIGVEEQADAALSLGLYLKEAGQSSKAIQYLRESLQFGNNAADADAIREVIAEMSPPVSEKLVDKNVAYDVSQGRLRVIANHAYIRDEGGRIVRTISRHTSVTFIREVGDKYEVEYRKIQGWVNKGQLVPDPTYSVDGLDPEVRDKVTEARLLHEEALEFLERDQDVERALTRLQRARRILQETDDQAALSTVLKELAYVHAVNGDTSKATEELNLATQRLAGSKFAQNPLLTAELDNARGHVAFNVADHSGALANYLRALETLRSNFGDKNAGTAALYGNVAKAHAYLGSLDKGKPLSEKQIAAMRTVYGDDTNEMSDAYAIYSEILSGLRDHARASTYSERALEIRKKLFGPDDLQTGNAHADFGRILWFGGNIDEAERQLDRALEICKFIDDPRTNNLEVSTRMSLVEMFDEANLPLDALTHSGPLLEALRASNHDVAKLITKYTDLAKNLKVAANRPPATAGQMLIVLRDGRIQDGTRIITTVAPGTHLWSLKEKDGWHRVVVDPDKQQFGWIKGATVTSVEAELSVKIYQAGDMLQKQQMIAKLGSMMQDNQELFSKTNPTREELIQALSLVDSAGRDVEAVGGNNFVLASMRQILAGTYAQFGEYGQARKHLEASLDTHIEHLGREHPTTAQDRMALGQTLVAMGDTVAAERQFREALRVIHATTGSKSQFTSLAKATLGNHLVNSGAIDEGKALLKAAVQTETAAGRGDERSMLTPLIALAGQAFQSNQADDAITHLTRARSIVDAFKDVSTDIVSDIMLQMQIGIAQLRAGQQDKALQNLTESYQRADRDLGPAHAITSTSASFLGYATALYDLDLDQAVKLAQSGLDIAIQATGPEHIQIVEPLVSLSSVTYRTGDLTKTLDLLDRSRAVTNQYVRENLVEMPAQAQVQFLDANHRRKRDGALSLVLKHTDDQDVIDRTAFWMLNSKGLAIETAAARGTLQNFLKTEFSRNKFAEWQALRSRISTFPLEGANDRVRDARKAELKKLKAKEQKLRTAIAPGFAEQVARQQSGMVDLNSVQSELAKDTVLIELLRLRPIDLARIISPDEPQPDRYVAWIVPPITGGEVQFIDLGEAEPIDKLIAAAQAGVLESPKLIKGEGPIEATKKFRTAMRPLTSAVWEPIRKAIGGSTKLIISPDANLWLVPWAAIPINDGRYLVEDVEIQLLNTGRDLVSRGGQTKELGRPVIIADPAFDSDAKEIEDTIRSMELDTLRTRGISFNRTFKVRPLPGTRDEARIIEPSLQISNNAAPETFVGKRAAEAVFKSLERPRTLMVGTHGFVFTEEQSDDPNPLARCGLLLAGCNESAINLQTTGEDGVLTGAEIVGTDLRGTELVVLSACQTGLGTVQDGEGVAGLRQAFQLAGAESVVATLWEIPDKATVRLIVALFDGLALKKTKPAALRDAQVKRINSLRDREGAAHPFFWAAFTVTGQK